MSARARKSAPPADRRVPALRRGARSLARAAYLLAALVAAAVLLGNRGFRSYLSGVLGMRAVRKEVESLKKEEESLKKRIEAVLTDDRELERAARRDLGLQRPGEIEYRFPPPGPGDE